jgi:hypothetical protein
MKFEMKLFSCFLFSWNEMWNETLFTLSQKLFFETLVHAQSNITVLTMENSLTSFVMHNIHPEGIRAGVADLLLLFWLCQLKSGVTPKQSPFHYEGPQTTKS